MLSGSVMKEVWRNNEGSRGPCAELNRSCEENSGPIAGNELDLLEFFNWMVFSMGYRKG